MKLKIKDMNMETGGPLVAMLNVKDALLMDLHSGDRIKIQQGKKLETVLLNITSSKSIPKNTLGLFEEVFKTAKFKPGSKVKITPTRKPLSIEFIRKKLEGHRLSREEIHQIVWDIVNNKLDSTELAFFVAAAYARSLGRQETIWLTQEMTSHGDILKINKYPIMDKHCVGGVAGNRTTMIVVPIIAAAGLTIPKTSSRSITSPAGTADTMEVLANVCLDLKQVKKTIKKTKGVIIWGGALNLAPADDKIIHVEKTLSIDAKSQLLASIIAKKASVSATHLLIDIPCGPGSKIPTTKKANILKKDFIEITRHLGMKTQVVLTDGTQPIGHGIGPALEAKDVLYVLLNDKKAPNDLKKKSIMLAGKMLEMAKVTKNGQKMARELIDSGEAYKKMIEIIKAQGALITNPEKIKVGKFTFDQKATKSGKITSISNDAISKIARVAGAPRDKGAGIYLYHHKNDKVKRNDIIYTIYAERKHLLKFAKEIAKAEHGISIK
ncbi:MAG: AMP phosphorylase [Nanoarchaeota archaeon]|nr:AMP phosphorylase [Nanoarchaeota archaeon]